MNTININGVAELFRAASNLYNKLDFFGSIDALNRIDRDKLSLEQAIEYSLLKAASYIQLDIIGIAIEELNLHFYGFRPDIQIYSALVFCHILIEDFGYVNYLLLSGEKEGFFDDIVEFMKSISLVFSDYNISIEEYIECHPATKEDSFQPDIQLLEDREKDNDMSNLSLGRHYFSQDMFDLAIKTLSTIPKESACYTEARCIMALIMSVEKNYSQVEHYINDEYINKESFEYFTHRIMIAVREDKLDIARMYLDKINQMQDLSSYMIRQVIITLIDTTFHKDMLHYCKLILEQDPYDIRTLMYAAESAYNCKDMELSKQYFKTILMINPRAVSIKTYLRIVENYGKINRVEEYFKYTFQLQSEDVDELIDKTRDIVVNSNTHELSEQSICTIKTFSYLRFTSKSAYLATVHVFIREFLSYTNEWKDFLSELLLIGDNDGLVSVNKFVKTELIKQLLVRQLPKNIEKGSLKAMLDNTFFYKYYDIAFKFFLKFPNAIYKANRMIVVGYIYAYVTLFLLSNDFFKKYKQELEKLTKAFIAIMKEKQSDCNDLDYDMGNLESCNLIAALFFYQCRHVVEGFGSMKNCAGLFSVNIKLFKEYKKLITEYEDKIDIKKQKALSNKIDKSINKVIKTYQ